MSNQKLRIDWFDGTLVEDVRPNVSTFADEETPVEVAPTPQIIEKKPIGFKRLYDISLLEPPILNLEVSNRPGFWHLFDSDLKGDFIVLLVKILSAIYITLEPGEKSKISNLLKNRFEESTFLVVLKEYIISLPNVRLVDKRMNLQLWDDAQLFYRHVIDLCDGMINFGTKNMTELLSLLEETETSIIGVRDKHMETFSESMFTDLYDTKLKLSEIISEIDTSTDKKSLHNDTRNFRHLNILPNKNDLLGQNISKIQPNIVNGAYESVEHYLDLQFTLLREDCFGPLRDGICKYLKDPSKRRYENIIVYPKIRIIRSCVTNKRVGHLIDMAWEERTKNTIVDCKRLGYNKHLMFGSLLLFTHDNFETVLCATVLNSNMNLLEEGYIAVSFHSPVSETIYSQAYVMVESEVFFEPYHRVLKVLQNSRSDKLPMKRYIVDVQNTTNPPSYLTDETKYIIKQSNTEVTFPVLNQNWPTQIDLDSSQFGAYKFALTREFAVIQGPPGTGKTYMGIRIASTLLNNLSLDGTPMLVICYTNHALDQFLEGILKTTKNIVRLGSQSKSKILEPYNLKNFRMKSKNYSYLYAKKKSELENIYKQMIVLQMDIEKCEKTVLCYNCIKTYVKVSGVVLELGCSDDLLNWLFESECNEVDDWEKQFDDSVSETIESCFSDEIALKEIESLKSSMKYVKDVTKDLVESQKMIDRFEKEISKIKHRLNYFKNQLNQEHKMVISKLTDPYKLSQDQRWAIYFNAVKTVKGELLDKMNLLLEQHNKCSDELDEVSTISDGEVVRTAKVVGVTTTTAARRHDLMKILRSPIVIVEEAAEVLEAHIVASLTSHCQHLILIGDHKQLRPSPANYILSKDYNLDISLFERMIQNGVHAVTLTTQRRMRPVITELLVPHIYNKLDSHPDVYKYSDVVGMKYNMFFYTHEVFEDSEGLEDSWSHKNTYEAEWCVSLANYLRKMGYSGREITILSSYTGQSTLINKLSKKYASLSDVKITVVDNYQGEENRIVILSLVRSNKDGNIGFLNATNRICVALSRAKEGFYVFGNMKMLKSSSQIWRLINNKLEKLNAINTVLTTVNRKCPNTVVEIRSPAALDKLSE